jgi:N6-adenosine-specific RNA methylase IME4
MSEEEKSPTGESRAVEVSSDLTNSPPVPTTQEDRTISLTRKKHDAIYFDPPGSIRNWSPNGTAIFHYDGLTFEELATFPILDHAANNCVLFLGATPLLDRPFQLIRAWGFKYEEIGYFCFKQNIRGESFFTSVGSWSKASRELCFRATRGKPKRWATDVPPLVFVPRISPRGAAGMPPSR